MPHVVYDVNKFVDYLERSNQLQQGASHSIPQDGSGIYTGFLHQRGGIGPYSFGPVPPQHGRGVLGVVKKIAGYLGPWAESYLKPIAIKALKALADEGMDTGQKLLGDIAEGRNVKEAVTSRGSTAAKNLIRKAGAALQEQAGSGTKRRRAGVYKKKRKQNTRLSNLHLVGRSVLEAAARRGSNTDNLGLY